MEPRSSTVLILFLLAGVRDASGYYSNQFKVPNGDKIPHPCKPNYIWRGLGHESAQGGGNLNPFGELFKSEGQRWTKALCQADADGDGRSNGEELGDPQCLWQERQPAPLKHTISHPGVCEPMNSTACGQRNSWVDCGYETFSCPALQDPGLQNLTLQFARSDVPAQETTYMCQVFQFAADQDYHMVALTPIIDNRDVIHHMLLYGCDEQSSNTLPRDRPFSCMMGTRGCSRLLGGWTLGSSGLCFHPKAGFRLGRTGYRTFLLEVHWNNPTLKKGTTDASGLTIHYTKELRPFDAGFLWTGQMYLEIPPNRREVALEGVCPSSCTRRLFKEPIYVIMAINHMHYMGIRQKVEVIRGDQVITINEDNPYSYDSPQWKEFSEPLQLLPGDELRATCVFNSLGKNKTTFDGQATSDEMCFGFLIFYPLNNTLSQYCTAWRGISSCELSAKKYRGCDMQMFLLKSNQERGALFQDVEDNCREVGPCLQECRQAASRARAHPCLHGDAFHYIASNLKISPEGLSFFQKLQTCPEDSCIGSQTPNVDTLAGHQAALQSSVSTVLVVTAIFHLLIL